MLWRAHVLQVRKRKKDDCERIYSTQFRIEKSYKKEILDTRRRAEELRMPMLLKYV